MTRHPQEGVHILREMPFYQVARQIAGGHHEKWDGSGYPLGLRGEAIPLPARIVAVADIFDALAASRPYKRAWPHEEALSEIRRLAGSSLDPGVTEAFTTLYQEGVVAHIMEQFADH